MKYFKFVFQLEKLMQLCELFLLVFVLLYPKYHKKLLNQHNFMFDFWHLSIIYWHEKYLSGDSVASKTDLLLLLFDLI